MVEVRVLVVAEDGLSRMGLVTLLADQPGCTVVGQVAAMADLRGSLDVFRPDVLLWDLGWNPATGLPLLAGLRDWRVPAVLLLPDVTHAREAWTNEARGLLLRQADGIRLATALAAAAQGLTVLDPEMAGSLISSGEGPLPQPIEELTPRELEVLRLLAEGLPNKGIASTLGISEHTVKFHVNAILGKLGAQSRTEAVVHATRLGLILL